MLMYLLCLEKAYIIFGWEVQVRMATFCYGEILCLQLSVFLARAIFMFKTNKKNNFHGYSFLLNSYQVEEILKNINVGPD